MIRISLPLLVVVAVVGLVGLLGLSNPVAAQQADIERSLSHSEVAPGDELTVTITNIGLQAAGGFGSVEETIPDGFTYVTGSAINTDGGSGVVSDPTDPAAQPLIFTLVAVDSFRYKLSVDSDAADGPVQFSGIFKGFGGTQRDVLGDDEVTVSSGTTTPDPDPSPVNGGNGGTAPGTDMLRALPASAVEPGDEFDVTISGLGLGAAGGLGTVEETLPAGFSYVSGSASVDSGGNGAVVSGDAAGQTVTFTLLGVDSFTYMVAVGSGVGDGQHDFSGAFINFAGARTDIGGDTSVTVMAPEPPVGSMGRSFSSDPVDAGDTVTVTIAGLGLGAAGGIATVEETLPS